MSGLNSQFKKVLVAMLVITIILALLLLPSYMSGQNKILKAETINKLEKFNVENGKWIAAGLLAVWTVLIAKLVYHYAQFYENQQHTKNITPFYKTSELETMRPLVNRRHSRSRNAY